MSTTTPNLGLFKYNTTTDTAVPFSIDNALNANWDIIDQRCGASRNIGEIVSSTVPLTDAGLHLLDGSLIDGDGIYSEFVDYVADLYSDYPSLFCSESDWQTAVTTYGVCGKFVYNSTDGTVRLPKITGVVEGTTDLTALGDLIEAGLPDPLIDIVYRQDSTSSGVYTDKYGTDGYTSGTYSNSGGTDEYMQTSLGKGVYAPFGAVPTNDIYGNSNTVQPQTIKVLYYIVIATSTKTNIQVDIDEIATDLNGKVNISDCLEVHCIIETYQNGTSWYRVYSDGWCEQGGKLSGVAQQSAGDLITLLKPYRDNNYYPMAAIAAWAASWSGELNSRAMVADNSTFYIQSGGNNNPSDMVWYACGYIN